MADGQNANVGFSSYLCVGRETTFGTYSTCTAGLNFLSASLKNSKDGKILEEITNKRTFANRIGLGRSAGGDIECYMAADSDACQYLLQNAMGGGVISSATATGDTTGSGVMEHTYSVNNFDATYSSLCINHRKGDSTNGKIFEYNGLRVNEMKLKGEIDDALIGSFSLIGLDVTTTSNNVSAAITVTGQSPLEFTGMRFSVADTFASLTSSAFWHVQSFEFGIGNNLKADADSRRIGSDVLQVLPPGIANLSLQVSMRFDTLTAYNAMLNQSQMAVQLECLGNTLTGSALRQSIKINLPRVYIKDAGDPEVSGPDEILKAEIVFDVLRDTSTSTGYAVQFVVRNKTASY